MIRLFKPKRATSLLGIALDGSRLEAVSLKRHNGTLQIRHAATASLALSPLTGDPALVGQEIRNHLDKAGARERRCAVCLPLSWVLSLQIKLPDLPEADLAGFLQIEAERGFPSGNESLFVVHSRFKAPNGDKYVTLLAVPRNHLESLERALRAAKLKPVLFAVGIGALQSPVGQVEPRLFTLAVGANTLDLQVTGGGGIVALRSLGSAIEGEGAQRRISADLVAREIRITLGQLPDGFADGPGKINVFGESALARPFVNEISARLQAMGLKIELMERACAAEFDKPIPSDVAGSPALALAGAYVRGGDTGPDFLPPKVQPWQRLVSTRFSTRKLAWAGGAAATAIVCVGLAFGIQQWQISTLRTQWDKMAPKVTELQAEQDQIKKFRSWYDSTYTGLKILRKLTEAFPDNGSVSAKTVEIRDLATVTCSGVASDNSAFLRLHGNLSKTPEISDLHAEVRGQKPLQFSLNYQWGGANGNGD
jgi:hypothetical protein